MLPVGDIIRAYSLNFMFYSDDEQLYISFHPDDADPSLHKMQACITEICQWMAFNMLSLNLPKTEFLIAGTPQQRAKLKELLLEVEGSTIYPSKEARNLGVIFDEDLSYHSHVAALSKAAYYQLYNIQQVRPSLTKEAAATAINAFVTSKLDSTNAVLHGLPRCVTYKLQKIQNSAARTLTGAKRREHITPVLCQLHWLPIRRRVEYKLLTLVFKAKNGIGPVYLQELIQPYRPARSLRSGDEHLLIEPRTHLVKGDRAFQKAGPSLWNNLPLAIRSLDSISVFKQSLKTHLFRLEYGV